MSKRGAELTAQFRYLFPTASRARSTPRSCRTTTRPAPTATASRGSTSRASAGCCPGLAASVNINKVSDDFYFTDLSDHISATSQTNLPREVALDVQPARTSDSSRASSTSRRCRIRPRRSCRRTTGRRSSLMNAQRLDCVRLRRRARPANSSTSRIRRCSPATARRCIRAIAYPVKWRRLLDHAEVRLPHVALLRRRRQPRGPVHQPHGADREPRRERRARARHDALRRPVHCRRSSRARSTCRSRRASRRRSPTSTARSPTSRSRSSSPRTAIPAATASTTRSSSRVALTSRLIEPATGNERLRVSVGERFYFTDQEVTLFETPRIESRVSDVVATATGRLADAWMLDSGVQYAPTCAQLEKLNFGVRYQPQPGKVAQLSATATCASC